MGVNGTKNLKNVSSGNFIFSGQLGVDKKKSLPSPILFTFDSEIVDLSCGSSFSMALTKDGELYSWGLNDESQVKKKKKKI